MAITKEELQEFCETDEEVDEATEILADNDLSAYDKLVALDEALEGTFGVEGICEDDNEEGKCSPYGSECLAEYLNTGDTYSATILYDHVSRDFYLTTWGDYVEEYERQWHKEKVEELNEGNVREDIVESMARTLFVLTWADCAEEHGQTFSGMELFDCAPVDTPMECEEAAEKLADRIIVNHTVTVLDKTHVPTWGGIVCRAKAWDEVDKLGHYLVMESLGHGVAWSDDHPEDDHGLNNLPLICASASLPDCEGDDGCTVKAHRELGEDFWEGENCELDFFFDI